MHTRVVFCATLLVLGFQCAIAVIIPTSPSLTNSFDSDNYRDAPVQDGLTASDQSTVPTLQEISDKLSKDVLDGVHAVQKKFPGSELYQVLLDNVPSGKRASQVDPNGDITLTLKLSHDVAGSDGNFVKTNRYIWTRSYTGEADTGPEELSPQSTSNAQQTFQWAELKGTLSQLEAFRLTQTVKTRRGSKPLLFPAIFIVAKPKPERGFVDKPYWALRVSADHFSLLSNLLIDMTGSGDEGVIKYDGPRSPV